MTKWITLNQKGKTVEEIEIPQEQLTSECWIVQFKGLKGCEMDQGCPYINTDKCTGQNIRNTLLNKGL